MMKHVPNVKNNNATSVVLGGNVLDLYVCAYVTGLNLRLDLEPQQIGAIVCG